MTTDATVLAYLIASVLFILSLRGLSSPESSRMGLTLGIVGMVIAILTTLLNPSVVSYSMIIFGILLGGSIGTFIALKIQMTTLPQLVAAFHSLVGLAAVFVAISAFYNPEAFGIGVTGNISGLSLLELSLGTVIGAITFSGSVIAFLKLQGIMGGSPIIFQGQHKLNALLAVIALIMVILLVQGQAEFVFWSLKSIRI